MITFVRTAAIAPGKGDEAMAFAHKVARTIEDKTRTKLSVSVPVGGNPFRIAWIGTYDSLAQLESSWARLMADADYRSMLLAAGPYFLPGSVHDEMWTIV